MDGDEKNLRAGKQVYQWIVGLFLACWRDPGGPGLVSGLTVDFGTLLHRDSTCWGEENKSRTPEISSLGCVGAAVFALSREITNLDRRHRHTFSFPHFRCIECDSFIKIMCEITLEGLSAPEEAKALYIKTPDLQVDQCIALEVSSHYCAGV